jgi:hypothetical protein
MEIERGLLEPAELAAIVQTAELKTGPELTERAEAARKALKAGRHADA